MIDFKTEEAPRRRKTAATDVWCKMAEPIRKQCHGLACRLCALLHMLQRFLCSVAPCPLESVLLEVGKSDIEHASWFLCG